MRNSLGVVFGICAALVSGAALAADHSGDPHWIQDSQSGCWIYNAEPGGGDEAIVWTGSSCGYGQEANGAGKVTWFKNNSWVLVEQGEMRGGLMNGPWVHRFANGNVIHANWQDGVRQADNYADDSGGGGYSSGGGSSYTPTYDGNAYLETLKRQNRENCERAAQGYDVPCHPE